MKKKKNYWSDPLEFLEAMRRWQGRGRVFSDQDELCLFFYPLAQKTVAAFGRGHIPAEDLVQWCVLSCCQKSKYYKEEWGSCFNFFTKVIINKISDIYEQENRKFNPKTHQSISDDEFMEGLASLSDMDKIEKHQIINPRPITNALDIFMGDKNAEV